MFACTKRECPREVVRRRDLSAEKGRFQKQEGLATQVRERKRLLEEMRHQEKVDSLVKQPCESFSDESGSRRVVTAEKQRAQEERSKQVAWRREQLEKIRRSQILHEQKVREENDLAKTKRPGKKGRGVDEAHVTRVQERRAELSREAQKRAEVSLSCRNHLAEGRMAEIRRNRREACEKLRARNEGAGEKVRQKQGQIERREREIAERELEVKNLRANYVLGIQPPPQVKSLFKPKPKRVPEPFVPPKYELLQKTYNLEFLRLKFKADEEKWLRRNSDFVFPDIDSIIQEWKFKCSFEDPDLQFGQVQKEFANAEETLQLEQKFRWISAPVSVQVMQEMSLQRVVGEQEKYHQLRVAEKIGLLEEMRREQTEAVDAEIDRRVRGWTGERSGGRCGGGGKFAQQLEQQGVGGAADKGEQTRDKLDYAKLLYRNVMRRWND